MLRHFVFSLFLLNTAATCQVVMAQNTQAHNPVIYADVPDMSIIRVGNKYYMSSTTMHMSPGSTHHGIDRSGQLENDQLCLSDLRHHQFIKSEERGKHLRKRLLASCLRYTRECITSAPLPNQPAELISIKQKI
jgi:beta-xylosidase